MNVTYCSPCSYNALCMLLRTFPRQLLVKSCKYSRTPLIQTSIIQIHVRWLTECQICAATPICYKHVPFSSGHVPLSDCYLFISCAN